MQEDKNITKFNLPEILGEYRFDYQIKNWFDIKSKAEIFFKPANQIDLQNFLEKYPKSLKISILGASSNVIIQDEILNGVLVKIGAGFSKITHYQEDNRIIIESEAGNFCNNIANYCKKFGLSGLEFFSGIPGSVGGAVAMNAGCYNNDVANNLKDVEMIDYSGKFYRFTNKDCKFSYRKNQIVSDNQMIITNARFFVNQSTPVLVEENIKKLQTQRELSQPIRAKTGGSTFKNPEGYKAWQLIDLAGCRGLKNGDAQISEKHCNFMINTGNATAKELIDLGNTVIDKVFKNSNILLEWEIKFIK